MADACEVCGVLDALGRHDGACSYAIRIGLPRLAEDEEPISPADSEEPIVEYDEDVDLFPGSDRPGAIERAPAAGLAQLAIERGIAPALPTALWFAYESLGDTAVFDATVFDSELEALRHAVERGKKVHRLELGKSLREQVSES